jgi:hypothetical protein
METLSSRHMCDICQLLVESSSSSAPRYSFCSHSYFMLTLLLFNYAYSCFYLTLDALFVLSLDGSNQEEYSKEC